MYRDSQGSKLNVFSQEGFFLVLQMFPFSFCVGLQCDLNRIACFLSFNLVFTFTPGVKQQVDVIVGVVRGCSSAARAVCFHQEFMSPDNGRSWRFHQQLHLFSNLLHNNSLPVIPLQLLPQRNDDMSSL